MRNTFSQLKDSFLGMVKKSTDTTDSTAHEESDGQASFYRQWMQCGHSLSCQIISVQLVPRVLFERPYAAYVVEVHTDVGQFQVRKRYSQFQQFYQQCRRHTALSCGFPPRTILQFGWSQDVTSRRLYQINRILSQIQSSNNKPLQLELFSFLCLYEHCCHEQLRPKEPSLLATDEFLLLQLDRLKENPANILEGLQRIQLSLVQRKKRLGLDVAKQLLSGGEDGGLLTLVMESMNELVVKEGLRLLNWLISPETSRDWETFRKALAKCIPGKLVLEREELRMGSEVGGEYFKLLSCYLGYRQQQDLHVVAQYYSESARFEKQYQRWAKYNNLS